MNKEELIEERKVKHVRNCRIHAQREIERVLRELERETGCNVSSVSIPIESFTSFDGDIESHIGSVNIDLLI